MREGRREAFIGLIAPIGVDLDAVSRALVQALNRVSYKLHEIKLTDIFKENPTWYNIEYRDEIERYQKFIRAGDNLCRDSGRKDVLALYGIASLSRSPERSLDGPIDTEVIHVFRQLKRPEEIRTLKEVFGRNIVLLGCYSPKVDRINYLMRKLRANDRGTGKSKLEAKALTIIATDEDERENPFGQRVIDCFPSADFVLDCSTHDSLSKSADRFVNIYFGYPFISPSVDEYCSYVANIASYRSLDLSRQVGAAIYGNNCEIISMGCNEVPKAGGGTYWAGGDHDFRDYALGYDSNQKVREDMARDTLVRLQRQNWLAKKFKGIKPDDLVNQALSDDERKSGPLYKSMISDIIEFGRMVHAEMNALTDAARFRRSTKDATLYCTTLPCHMCTKLIIASGIKRVVYIQPYGKSLIEELFPDSVSVEESTDDAKVLYETLKGVTPSGFKIAFHKSHGRKEKDGTAQNWNPNTASPTFLSTFPYYMPMEIEAIEYLRLALDEAETARSSRPILRKRTRSRASTSRSSRSARTR